MMKQRLIGDESGITLALAMMMIVLIGVMGAGLLTFVTTDLTNVAEANRGQQAFQVADAGVQAAKQQIIKDSAPTTSYDGGTDDRPWSYCYNITGCSSATPTDPGADGMTLNMDIGTAKVTILMTDVSSATYKVISTGCVPDCTSPSAKRKVEAVLRSDADVTFPRTYVTRTDLAMNGSINPLGISLFALGNATLSNNVNLGNQPDSYYGKWAETTGAGPYPNPTTGSYPNTFNETARSTNLAGVAAWGTITSGTDPSQVRGTRIFGSNTTPAVVQDYYASPLAPSAKIAFPFGVPTDAQDRAELDRLRERALLQETTTNPLYIDSNPGNGVNDAGMANLTNSTSPLQITNWPSGSNFDTVRFYEFQSYNVKNAVTYNNSSAEADCDTTPPFPKGVIVVENGDFAYSGNKLFNGGVIVRAYASGASIPTQGKFTASGNPCLRGYANSGGTMSISGNISLGNVPELGTLGTFKGGMEQVSWRELYK